LEVAVLFALVKGKPAKIPADPMAADLMNFLRCMECENACEEYGLLLLKKQQIKLRRRKNIQGSTY
jgi:hypothetical protein